MMPGAWGRETISVTRQPFAADPQNVNLTSYPCLQGSVIASSASPPRNAASVAA
jgi:hypothetical protein